MKYEDRQKLIYWIAVLGMLAFMAIISAFMNSGEQHYTIDVNGKAQEVRFDK